MKKIFASALVAATVMVATPAMAAVNIPLSPTSDGQFKGAFASDTKTGTFTDEYEFTIPGSATGVVGASVISLNINGLLSLTKVLLNGTSLDIFSTPNGNFFAESPLGGIASKSNPQTLTITGTTKTSGTYSGNVAFVPAAAVPEPATWALMMLGFGVVGYAMRRRPNVRFVQAI